MNNNVFYTIKEWCVVIFAAILYAVALKYFILPSEIILTGTEGIAASLSYFFDSYKLFIVLYLIFQGTLLLFAFFNVSRVFAFRTLLVVATVFIFLSILPNLEFARPEPQNERIILVLFGGILSGTAKGIAFKHRGSTGDEDIFGAYFATKYLKPVGFISIGAALISTSFGLILNIIKNGNFEMAVNTLMYTAIYIFVSSEMLNNLYKKFQTTLISIVTDDYSQIKSAIHEIVAHRTFTVQKGSGGFSGNAFCVVQIVLTKEELPAFLDKIHNLDTKLFYYFHDLEGVSREYYISPIQ